MIANPASGSDRFQPYLTISGTGTEVLLDGPGDIDGDGCDDLRLAWVPPVGPPLARVRSGLNGALIFQLSPQPYSGGFMSGAGFGGMGGRTLDLNADGHGELVLVRTGQDMIQVRSGLDGSLMSVLTPAMFGWSPSGFGGIIGWGLSAPGDLNGDGSPDLIVRGGPAASCSEVVVLGGPSLGLLYQHSAGCGTPFGSSIGPIEDVSGDGYPDYFIGDPGASPNTALPSAGWIGFYSGATGQLMTSVSGTQPGQVLG
ncbi:MAG: FG-GAP repeat domain-containing protein, partial [Planctomycetota bacterium]